MTQKISPFGEAKYGWDFGESGWNGGMDENILKFSFLFDRNIDGIIDTLPANPGNGSAYFLTTDSRLYFRVSSNWLSSPTPRWFVLVIRTTGELYQFDGSTLVSIESSSDLSDRIEDVELTLSTLGSAAFQNGEYFATQASLDVVEASLSSDIETVSEGVIAAEERFERELFAAGYTFLGNYTTDLNITTRKQYFRRGDRFYAANEGATLPYTTTGDWTGDSAEFKWLGDDVLREELTDPQQGASMIGRGVVAVDSIVDLLAVPPEQRRADLRFLVKGYHAGSNVGGGEFSWVGAGDAAQHDGGFCIAPAKSFPTDWNDSVQRADWFSASSGAGVFQRSGKHLAVDAEIYGAKADYDIATGVGTDDSDSINQALSKNSVVVLPGRAIRVTKSINLTLKYGGAILSGTGGSFVGGAFVGTVIAGDTGAYPVIDRGGSQNVKVTDIVILPGLTTPASVGVLDQRVTISQYAQFNVLERVFIDMKTNPAANSGAGTIGVCNVAAEIGTVRDCYIKADTGYYFGSTPTPYNVPSLYATQGGPSSCSTLYFEGSTVLHSYNPVGAPLVLNGTAFVQGDVYVGGDGGEGSHGFRFIGLQRALKLRLFVEFQNRCGLTDELSDCEIECLGGFVPTSNIKTRGGFTAFTNSTFKFTPTISSAITPPDYWLEGSGSDIVRNCKIIAPANPAVRFVVPTDETYNLFNNEFIAGNTSQQTKQSFKTRTSDFSDRPLRLGSYDLWIDSNGMLRKNSGAATSALDGAPLGEKVTVPPVAATPGKPGQWAADSAHLYIYVGDGATHSWLRAPLSTW